eukprot:7902780-Alexandrium_andersonii.AAC.1
MGDGYCRRCKSHNFKRHQHCRHCGMSWAQFDYPRDVEEAARYESAALAVLAPPPVGSDGVSVKDEEVESGQAALLRSLGM